jgi:hypothetical protein
LAALARGNAIPKPVRGDWRISIAFRNHSESFNRVFRGLPKAFNPLPKISLFFPESRIINGLQANGGKKISTRSVGRASPRRTVLMRENALRAPQLHIPLARLVLVHPNSRLPPPG